MTVIKHALSEQSFILYIHCQAATTLSTAVHLNMHCSGVKLSLKCVCDLSDEAEGMGYEETHYMDN